jgi:ABC-2 type transport system ATP-binding protein
VSEEAVVVSGLVKRYGAVVAVDDVTLTARRGQVTALLGPNGAGKTTTLEIIEGLRTPDRGRVRVLGLDPADRSSGVGTRMGVMLQEGGGGYPGAKAGEMLRHVAALYTKPHDVDMVADALGLRSMWSTPVRRLSVGQRQRLSFAMAMIGRPEVLLLDEPTAGLDPQARRATWDLIDGLRAAGVAVLLTTHHMDEAERLSDAISIMDHGRVLTAGTTTDLVGSELEVSFTGPPGMPLHELSRALPDGVQVTEAAPGRYRANGPVDPESLATLTAWCASHGVLPHGLTVGRRSLEDVFLGLTGRALR